MESYRLVKKEITFDGFQIIVTCACEEANAEVSKEYDVLRRMIDSEENFLEVKALGEDLAMQVLKLVDYCIKVVKAAAFFTNTIPQTTTCTAIVKT